MPASLPVLENATKKNSRVDTRDHDLERLAADLRALIRGEVRFSLHDRMLYATDASVYQVTPIGVVTPRDVPDVEAVMKYCEQHRVPVLPRGGGTSLAGQCTNRAVVVDLSPF